MLVCLKGCTSGGVVDTEATAVSLVYSYDSQGACCHGQWTCLRTASFSMPLRLQSQPPWLHLTFHSYKVSLGGSRRSVNQP